MLHSILRKVRPWRALVAGCASVALTLVFLLPQSSLQQAHAQPAGLPSHFAFGVSAGQGDTWMPGTGIGWDYRMQYLAGGVNSGAGWETWNASGTFALNYANESAQHGYTPMFPYYELLQSNGSCSSCAENQKDLTNLNTASLMQAYFSNFELLMKRLGPGSYDSIQGFGRTALVNIEPDFTGGYAYQAAANNGVCFGFCTAQGADPSFLKASVANSGFADVAAYPNTYAGYVQALSHLRDLYAPNVLLGLDVSPWATGDDIGMDTNPSLNVVPLGQQVGTFLTKAGPHDLLFSNPLDRDAGQYKAVFGQNRWWDRQNVTFPNFHRWEQYLQATSAADGGRSMLLWQVPVGNQYFDTENNTNDHYQDNRPEYIFSHVTELVQAGIVGAIFAPGNAGNTSYTDSDSDGVVNPTSFCTTDGTSSGQICNNHAASVADDDGGFIRMSAQAYYANPTLLSGGGGGVATVTPTPTASTVAATYASSATVTPSSSTPGQSVSIAASVTSSQASTALVDLEVWDAASNKVFQQWWDNQSFSAGQPHTFSPTWAIPATAAVGTYTVRIGVFAPAWGTLENWNASAASISVAAATGATSTATPTATSTPTAVPTNTPTVSPTSTPTSMATKQPSYTLRAAASPSTAAPGGSTVLTVSVKSATASTGLIDLEIYSSAGVKVFQQTWDNQTFSAGQNRKFSATWAVPSNSAPGSYTVKVGVFAPGGGTLYTWNSSAAVIKIT
jgi:hypothetical protein